jgi:hypothetical protein
MTHHLAVTSIPSSRSIARLCLGLLLLCGLIGSVGASPSGRQGATSPFIIDQIEQFAWASNGDNLRIRSDVRNSSSANDASNGESDPSGLMALHSSNFDAGLSSAAHDYLHSFAQLPSLERYKQPAPRAPPTA